MIMETYKLPNGDEFYRNSKGEFIYQDGRKMVWAVSEHPWIITDTKGNIIYDELIDENGNLIEE